jgi:ATP-binding cassette, subfamily B, bacterial
MAGGFGGGRFHFSEKGSKPVISKKILIRIAKYFTPYWKLLFLLVFSIVVTSILGLIPPVFTKNIIDIALPDKRIDLLVILIFSSFGALLINGIVLVGQNYLNSWISKNIIKDIRNAMFHHLQYMPIRFFSNIQAGEITSRMNNDIGGIENVFSGTVVQILQNIFIFATTASILFYTNWKLAIISMVILPLFIIPTRKVGKTRWKIATQTQEKLAELNTIIQETFNIGGIFLVKLFTKEKYRQDEFARINKEVTKLQMKESLTGRWFFMTITTIVSIGPMIIYLVGGILLIRYNEISIGSIIMFIALLNRFYGPVTSFANISVDVTRSLALFDRIFQYLDMRQDIVDAPNATELQIVKGAIKFTDVNFSYNDKTATLKNINIDIKPGQLIAFVGPSGAGKTTITYLLPRLYDIDSGSITIDGVDIREVTLESLRNQIGIVTQDTYLFNTTIRENLLFSKMDAGDEEIIQACKTANIHELIMSLSDGYETMVGERGIKLSGGEKQRLSIARTLLKNPRVVILDEATSSLDSVSESLIQEAIGPLFRERTSLVIAHRISTIIAADCIYVVDDGHIVENGTHEELLSCKGLYKELFDKQFKNHSEN